MVISLETAVLTGYICQNREIQAWKKKSKCWHWVFISPIYHGLLKAVKVRSLLLQKTPYKWINFGDGRERSDQ